MVIRGSGCPIGREGGRDGGRAGATHPSWKGLPMLAISFRVIDDLA